MTFHDFKQTLKYESRVVHNLETLTDVIAA